MKLEFESFRHHVRNSLGLQAFFDRKIEPCGLASERIAYNREQLEAQAGVSMSNVWEPKIVPSTSEPRYFDPDLREQEWRKKCS